MAGAPRDLAAVGAAARGHPPAVPHGRVRWRGRLRIAASVNNALLILYIYATYLAEVDWERFGSLQPLKDGESRKLLDYILVLDLDSAFNHLRSFSFSTAMLPNLDVYMLLGVPGSTIHLVLERDRISWLQALLMRSQPASKAHRVVRCLEAYFWNLTVGTVAFLFLARIHIDIPLAHYACSGTGLVCISAAMSLYLGAPVDFAALASSDALSEYGGKNAAAGEEWAARVQGFVRPVLWFVLWLTALCFASAVYKCEGLGDDRRSLVFGVLETATITGYQLFLGSFVVDDWMMDGKFAPLSKID